MANQDDKMSASSDTKSDDKMSASNDTKSDDKGDGVLIDMMEKYVNSLKQVQFEQNRADHAERLALMLYYELQRTKRDLRISKRTQELSKLRLDDDGEDDDDEDEKSVTRCRGRKAKTVARDDSDEDQNDQRDLEIEVQIQRIKRSVSKKFEKQRRSVDSLKLNIQEQEEVLKSQVMEYLDNKSKVESLQKQILEKKIELERREQNVQHMDEEMPRLKAVIGTISEINDAIQKAVERCAES